MLDALLKPRSIAVLGASSDFNKLNGRTIKALLERGYPGAIYPVNPKYESIGGLTCYPDVESIPGPIDLAVVTMPGALVPKAILDLGRRKVAAAVVFSSGFAEIGGDGLRLDAELKAAIAASGVRVLGPNCLGLINAFDAVMATFSQFAMGKTAPGCIGMVTQSGALGTTTAAIANRRGLLFGYLVTTGNECDVDFVEVMDSVLADDRIRVGAGFVEGLKKGPLMLEVARRAMQAGKPIVITKLGRTAAGAKAVASHTGSLAGEDIVFDHVMRQHGVIRARSDDQLLDLAHVFSQTVLPAGPGLGVMTRSGGAGALMADRAEEQGLKMASFTAETTAALKKIVPAFGSVNNPVDVTAQGLVDPTLVREAFKTILADPHVDVGVAWLGVTKEADFMVRTFIDVKAQSKKPFVVAWSTIPDEALVQLGDAGITVMRGPELAVDAIAALVRYGAARRRWLELQPSRDSLRLPALRLPATGGILPTDVAAGLLGQCGIPVSALQVAASADEAVALAEKLGYPVAVKIESPDIAHKTEAQGVQLGLRDASSVRAAFAEVTANARAYKPDAALTGVVVQAMAQPGVEMVVGVKQDAVFGPVVMVGLGGIFVEVLKDVVFRAAPVSDLEALDMLEELKGKAMLDGVRGRPAVDRHALAALISNVSIFAAAAGGRLQELDLNPVMVNEKGVTAVDVLMVLSEER